MAVGPTTPIRLMSWPASGDVRGPVLSEHSPQTIAALPDGAVRGQGLLERINQVVRASSRLVQPVQASFDGFVVTLLAELPQRSDLRLLVLGSDLHDLYRVTSVGLEAVHADHHAFAALDS